MVKSTRSNLPLAQPYNLFFQKHKKEVKRDRERQKKRRKKCRKTKTEGEGEERDFLDLWRLLEKKKKRKTEFFSERKGRNHIR